MNILLRLVLAWLALAWSGSAAATGSEVLLEFREDAVLAELRLPLRDLALALGRPLPASPLPVRGRLHAELARYLGTHIDPVTADGRHWWVELADMRVAVDDEPRVLVAHAVLVPPAGASARSFVLGYDAIARELPGHATRLAIRSDWHGGILASRPATLALLDAPRGRVAVDRDHAGAWRGWLAACRLGALRAADAGRYLLLLLVLALPAAVRSPALLARMGVAFALGQTLALLVAGPGWFRLPAGALDAVAAGALVLAAVHAVRPLFAGSETWYATGCGLLYGLAAAGTVGALDLDGWQLAAAILAFAAGCALAQAALLGGVLCVAAGVVLIARRRLAWLPAKR
ncbi:HupE / UreJ protein [Massilia sp. PDC64]|nr:HupE/UreJ family protein [Massilia sp. PDC64]SDD35513.1 HupE / UreJ protein [Massilia sp. PDC64]